MSTALANRLPTPSSDLQGYLRAIHSFPLLSETEERELAARYQRDRDLEAAWQLVTSHLRFVAKIARGYRGYGLPEEDLIQEGNVGLMKAVKRFDPTVGVRLVSFAVHWIRAEIHEFVLRNWRIVKVATTKAQRKLFFNLRGAKKRLGWLSAEEVQDVAQDLGVRPADVLEMERRLDAHDAVFDGALGDEGALCPADVLEDNRYEPAESLADTEWSEQATKAIHGALSQLDERSRDIVTSRWLTEPKMKLRELAEKHGVSAERIRQIEAEAMKSLRVAVEAAA